jgi:DNA polymerase III subunit alpha
MVSSLRSLTTKKGDPMAFGTLEDLESKIDLVFFPRTWKQHRMEVKEDQVLLVTGKLQLKGDDLSLLVDSVSTNLEIARDADYVPQPAASRT